MAGKKTRAPTIAFITVCRGRLRHLQESLPLMAAQEPDELIVVDYGCPDGTAEWVAANVPSAKVVRGSQPDGGFNISRARNLGAAAAASEWLFFVDADILLGPDILAHLRPKLRAGQFYYPQPQSNRKGVQIFGSFLCTAADFAAIEGYDEVIEGWGREDRDLYVRLQLNRVKPAHYPAELVGVIPHGDEARHVMSGMRDRWHNQLVNACYSEAKQKISLFRGSAGNLPLEERRQLMDSTRSIVGKWYAEGAERPLAVSFAVRVDPPQHLPAGMAFQSKWLLSITVRPPTRTRAGAARA